MTISATVAKAVNAAFIAVGDLKRPVTVTSYDQTAITRDGTTGRQTFSISTTYTGYIIVTEFISKENRANIESGDLRGIMKQSEIPLIQVSDLVTFDGLIHKVISIAPDPSNAIWNCQLRRNQ